MPAVPPSSPSTEHLLSRTLEQVRDFALMLLDPEGRIVAWFPGCEEIFGYTASEVLGHPVSILFTDDDVRLGIPDHEIRVATAEGRAQNDRYQRRKDGALVWVVGSLVALRDEAGNLIGFAKTLTNRGDVRQRLDELEHRVEELQRIVRRKDVFLSTLAHELRNPLAPLVNAIELINLTVPSTPGLEYPIRLIERQVNFIRRLVDDLLDLTRIGAGKLSLHIEEVNIADVLYRAVETVRPCIEQREHALGVFTPDSPIVLRGDSSRLQQVFVNLLQNACTYTPRGGKIWLNATVEEDQVVVRVIDNGVGIPHEMQERIFDLFTQGETPAHTSPGGLGIGLAVTRQIVAMHGGSIQVLSGGVGHGSQFIVRLPLHFEMPTVTGEFPASLEAASRRAMAE
ncbi:MAG TPA: PAS domain-containing sensor histidine kinase [Gemmatimonadaceae bacterium]